jgi:hypothetical protein
MCRGNTPETTSLPASFREKFNSRPQTAILHPFNLPSFPNSNSFSLLFSFLFPFVDPPFTSYSFVVLSERVWVVIVISGFHDQENPLLDRLIPLVLALAAAALIREKFRVLNTWVVATHRAQQFASFAERTPLGFVNPNSTVIF